MSGTRDDTFPESVGLRGGITAIESGVARRDAATPAVAPTDALLAIALRGVNEFSFGHHARCFFAASDVKCIGDLLQYDRASLLRQRHVGHRTVVQIESVLERAGLQLGVRVAGWPPTDIAAERTRLLDEIERRRAADTARAAAPYDLRTELRMLLGVITNDRARDAVSAHLGFDGRGGMTIASAARNSGVPWSRVSQSARTLMDRWRRRRAHVPHLRRALDVIASSAPGPAVDVERRISHEFAMPADFRVDGLLAAGVVVAEEPRAALRMVDGIRYIVPVGPITTRGPAVHASRVESSAPTPRAVSGADAGDEGASDHQQAPPTTGADDIKIAASLRESDPVPVRQIGDIVDAIGRHEALGLLAQTERIELAGGVMLPDGSRKRSRGGVFFWLARKRLSRPQRQRIFGREQQHQTAPPRQQEVKTTGAAQTIVVPRGMTSIDSSSPRDISGQRLVRLPRRAVVAEMPAIDPDIEAPQPEARATSSVRPLGDEGAQRNSGALAVALAAPSPAVLERLIVDRLSRGSDASFAPLDLSTALRHWLLVSAARYLGSSDAEIAFDVFGDNMLAARCRVDALKALSVTDALSMFGEPVEAQQRSSDAAGAIERTIDHALTNQDGVLLAAAKLADAVPTFTTEELVVAAWREYPDVFGLDGFRNDHPDSNRVLTKLMGSTGLCDRGWLERVGAKSYRITSAGIARAKTLRALWPGPPP